MDFKRLLYSIALLTTVILSHASPAQEAVRNGSLRNLAPTVELFLPHTAFAGKILRVRARAHDRSRADRAAGFVYRWSFGDGSLAERGKQLSSTTHTFSHAGKYRIKVRATDKHGTPSRTVSKVLTVRNAPHSAPDPDPTTEPVTNPGAPTPRPTPVNGADLIRVQPTELTSIFSNPGMGWQSGDQVKTSGVDSNGYPIKVAYVKFYWKNLETADGVYDFSQFNFYLNQARNAGQKLAFRLVVNDNITNGPQWLKNLGVAGYSFYDYTDNGSNSPLLWAPDFNDPVVQQRHTRFLKEMGRRYNNDAAIDSIDIGSIGNWGEWHYWGVTPAVPMPSAASLRAVIDAYFDAFPSIPKVAQLQPKEYLAYAVAKGAGFRGDCLGYIDNQHKLIYDPNITYAHAENAWKTAPVNFETCGTISNWASKGWDVKAVVDWALARHINAINNKNGSVPSSAKAQIDRLLLSMGYRFVLTEADFQKSAPRGGAFLLQTDWNNRGVTPSYGSYVLGVRLRPLAGGAPYTVVTSNKVSQWLPGPFSVDQNIAVPVSLAAGDYEVALAVINPATLASEVKLAIAGRDATGWYPLGTIAIQ